MECIQCVRAAAGIVSARRSVAALRDCSAAGRGGEWDHTSRRAGEAAGLHFRAHCHSGGSAPGGPPNGATFVNDFEPGGLNSQGDIAFGADVSSGGEGIFLRPHNGQITGLGRTNGPAPGGGSFEFGFLGPVGQNDQGDLVFDFLLKDFTPPFGVNAGTYRYSHATRKVTPVVIPFMTPVPSGGTFWRSLFPTDHQ